MRSTLSAQSPTARRIAILAAIALGSAGWLRAGIVPVGSPAGLGANDSVFWAQLGPVNTILPLSNNFMSTHGLAGTIIDGTPPQLRLNTLVNLTTNPVYDNQYGPPVTINFNSPVTGVGALVMNEFGSLLPFSYHIQVFNSGGSLGTINVPSPQISATPSYVGVLDSVAEITKVIFTVDAFSGNSGNYIAIDTLNLNDNAGASPGVPEPSSILLAGIGGLAVICGRLRRRVS